MIERDVYDTDGVFWKIRRKGFGAGGVSGDEEMTLGGCGGGRGGGGVLKDMWKMKRKEVGVYG